MSQMLQQCRELMEMLMSGTGSWMGGVVPMGGGMIIIGIVWLTLPVAPIVLIAWLIPRVRGPRTDADARKVLDVRYARGELHREAYSSVRADPAGAAPDAR